MEAFVAAFISYFVWSIPDMSPEPPEIHLPVAPPFWAYSASSSSSIPLSIATNYAGYAFIIDYISAQIVFNSNFVQDPYFTLDFSCMGNTCQHAFPLYRVPTTASAPEGYQLYLLSQQINFYVDPQSAITFTGQYLSVGTAATTFLQLTGRNQRV